MDYFSLCLHIACVVGQTLLHTPFVSRLTGKRAGMWHFALYLFLLSGVELLSASLAAGPAAAVCAELLALYGISRFALGNRRSPSLAAAVTAVYITQLSFGMVNSVQAVLFPHAVGSPLLYPLTALATLTAFAVSAGCCDAVLRRLSLAEDCQRPYVGLLLPPGLFFLAAQLYLLHISYSFSAASLTPGEVGKHGGLLLLQGAGMAALLCTLYAYQHACRGFQAQAALDSLSQAVQAQRVYIAEAQARCERTRSFRHDIKNHLSVLSGLLRGGEYGEAAAYLQTLETAASSLSPPYQTGNPAVDVLLGEKLALAEARGAAVEVSLHLPTPCGIDSFDLCVIFANALDNAISACQACEGSKFIRIKGERQGDFYMLGFENACQGGPMPPMGIGLANIRSVVEKYRGAMQTDCAHGHFSLHLLLNIS